MSKSTEGISVSGSDFSLIRAGSQPDGFDPYPLYRAMRSAAPVWQSPWGEWYLTSAAGVSGTLLNSTSSRSPWKQAKTAATDSGLARFLSDSVINLDAPAHTRLRSALSRAVAAPRLEELRPLIDRVFRSLLPPDQSASAEVVGTLTQPLPVLVVAELLGIPATDAPLIRKGAVLLRGLLDDGAPEVSDMQALAEMRTYFEELVRSPGWRAGSQAAHFRALLDSFPAEVAAANLMLFAFAGHETTIHLIGSLLFNLAQRPGLWQRLRRNPELAPAAVAEALRFESPVQKLCRWTVADIEIEGVAVRAGEALVLVIGAANRDPKQYASPDEFDVDRDQPAHLGFGRGPHLCLGRSLANLEATTVLQILLATWRDVEVGADGAHWLNNSSFRGLRRLDLRWQRQ